jgi:hypothetical protein
MWRKSELFSDFMVTFYHVWCDALSPSDRFCSFALFINRGENRGIAPWGVKYLLDGRMVRIGHFLRAVGQADGCLGVLITPTKLRSVPA